MQRIRLDEHALEIQLAQELLEDGTLMVLTRGVAGLGDRHAQGGGVQRHLGDESRAPTGGGFDRASQGLAVTHQLIKIGCTTWDLSDRPVPDGGADGSDVHVEEEVAKGRIRGRPPELDAQGLGEHGVVPASKTLQIPQALALAQDPEHRHQEQIPGRDAHAAAHAGVGDRLEEADQIEIVCSRGAFEHRKDAIPPTSTHGLSCGKKACDTL